jgi:hypothetical protein
MCARIRSVVRVSLPPSNRYSSSAVRWPTPTEARHETCPSTLQYSNCTTTGPLGALASDTYVMRRTDLPPQIRWPPYRIRSRARAKICTPACTSHAEATDTSDPCPATGCVVVFVYMLGGGRPPSAQCAGVLTRDCCRSVTSRPARSGRQHDSSWFLVSILILAPNILHSHSHSARTLQ